MTGGLRVLLLALCVVAGQAAAAQKIYEGAEAGALRCANIVALTGVALYDTGRLGEVEKEIMLGISFLMLQQHVSGSWPQKRAALEIVRDRRGLEETLRDFELLAEKCMRQYPIN